MLAEATALAGLAFEDGWGGASGTLGERGGAGVGGYWDDCKTGLTGVLFDAVITGENQATA